MVKISSRESLATKPIKIDNNLVTNITTGLLRDFYSKINKLNPNDFLYQHVDEIGSISKIIKIKNVAGAERNIELELLFKPDGGSILISRADALVYEFTTQIHITLNSSMKIGVFEKSRNEVTQRVIIKIYHELTHALDILAHGTVDKIQNQIINQEVVGGQQESDYFNDKNEFKAHLQEAMFFVKIVVQKSNLKNTKDFIKLDRNKKLEAINSIMSVISYEMPDFFKAIKDRHELMSQNHINQKSNFDKLRECIYRYLIGEFQ